MAPFLLIGGLILIAAYLVIRFAVIFAPALLTAGAFFPLRGIVVAAGRVVAAAILNGILFTLAVLLVIRVDAAILDPATRLPAWLRLVLVGVVTVVMWYLTRPFRKLTTMVTTGRMAFAMGDRSWYERGGGGGLFGRRRGLEAAVVDGDGGGAVIAPREESRGPTGVMRRAAAAATRRWRDRRRSGCRPPGSTRAERSARARRRGAAAAAGAAAAGAGGRRPGGRRPGAGGGGAGWRRRRRAAGPAAARRRRRPAARRRRPGAAGAARAAAAPARGAGARARPPAATACPVHSPPTPPRRRPVPSPVRAANRRLDEGLFDAGAPGRVAPEDDGRGYLRPVRVEVADDELYRLFDPASASRSGGRPGAAARDPAARGGLLAGPLGHPLAAPGDRRARAADPDRGGAGRRPDPGPGAGRGAATCSPAAATAAPPADPERSAVDGPARHHRPGDPGRRRGPRPTLAAAQRHAAVGYVTAANTHDARPGGDRAFADSYRRTKPYVTPELYRLVTAASRRGDYEWTQWTAAQATVRVRDRRGRRAGRGAGADRDDRVRAGAVPPGASRPTAGATRRAGHRRRDHAAGDPRPATAAGWSPSCWRTPEPAVRMSRRTLLLALAAPVAIPLVLLLVAAFMVTAIAGGGSVSSADVPANGVVGGTLKGGVPVPARDPRADRPVRAGGRQPAPDRERAGRPALPGVRLRPAGGLPGRRAGHRAVHAGHLGRARPGRERRRQGRPVRPGGRDPGRGPVRRRGGRVGRRGARRPDLADAGRVQRRSRARSCSTRASRRTRRPRATSGASSTWPRSGRSTPGLVGGGEGPVPPPDPGQIELTGNQIIDTAMSWAVAQIGSWYQWGGTCRDPFGPSAMGRCDCSSLMQQAYAHAGVSLPRVAADQARVGQEVPNPADVRPGDLIAIEGSLGSPTRAGHIGMYVGRGMVVESPHTGAQVRLSPARSFTDIVSIRRIVTG